MVVAMSINGQGEFWDRHALTCRPELDGEGGLHAGDILLAVREHLSDEIACTYAGDDVGHPDAIRAIEDWATLRAHEKADQLSGIEIADDGSIAVQRAISCRVEALRPALGVFWTSDVAQADIDTSPWHDGDEPTMLVSARVHHDDVDWQTSCMARMDWYSGDCELELRLKPGRRLHQVGAVDWLDERRRNGTLDPIILPDLDWTT